jgi:hypothetical protein
MSKTAFWECVHRLQTLKEFRRQIETYMAHSEAWERRYRRPEGNCPTDHIGEQSREKINQMIPKVSHFLFEAGAYPTVSWRDAPAAGGSKYEIDIIQNIFGLNRFEIPLRVVIDHIERGIGYYQNDLVGSLLRTVNPFWWLERLVAAIIRIPFRIVEWAGYDSDKAEESAGGKLYKVIAGLATFVAGIIAVIAAVIQTLDILGLSQPLIEIIQRLLN